MNRLAMFVTLPITVTIMIQGCITEDPEIIWNSYNENILNAPSDNNMIFLIYFTIPGCSGCHITEEKLFSNASVITVLSRYTCIKINALREMDLSKMYNISTYPTIIFLKQNKELLRIKGSITDAQEFLTEIHGLEEY